MWGWSLADRLELGPGVGPAHLQRCVTGEDVVAQLLQRGLRVRGDELSRLLHLLPDLDVDFLTGEKSGALIPAAPERY